MGKNSEKRNVQISLEKAIEWYKQGGELREVALQAYSEEELKDNKRPHSWKEFCEEFPVKEGESFISVNSGILTYGSGIRKRRYEEGANICINKKEAEAFLALMQLRQLRNAWIGDWEPDWNDDDDKGVIDVYKNKIVASSTVSTSYSLSFPTYEMAQDFLRDFRDLLETAKTLL